MKTKLEYFKEYAKDLKLLYTDLILIEDHVGDWGFICEHLYIEELDNHCNQCIEEQPLFFKFKEYKDFPFPQLSAAVGPTKFEKIVMGEFKLEHVKILDEKFR